MDIQKLNKEAKKNCKRKKSEKNGWQTQKN